MSQTIIIPGVRDPDTGEYLNSPTFESGDAKIIIPPAAPQATVNKPYQLSAYSTAVAIELTDEEDIAGAIIQFKDQTVPAEWEWTSDIWIVEDGNASPAAGAGSIQKTITVQSSGTPISGVECWVTTDIEGHNIVAGTKATDDFGTVIFLLDEGIYYLWRDTASYQFPNPSVIAVP